MSFRRKPIKAKNWSAALPRPCQMLGFDRFATIGYIRRAANPYLTGLEPAMRMKLLTLMVVASCLPAAAQSLSPRMQFVQGNGVTIGGRAHVDRGAEGTFINIENPALSRSVAGFIAFGDEPTFRGLSEIDGRYVEITGMVTMDGRALIRMDDPDQIRVKASDGR
jgi:hypothetical protein